MIGPHTRVVLRRNTKHTATVDIVVERTGQTIGWCRTQEVIDFLRTLGIYVRPSDDTGFR